MERFLTQAGTVLDKKTGLMWPENAAAFPFPMTWPEALAAIAEENGNGWKGHTDWHLPNRKELLSLVSHETVNPCLPTGHPFADVFTGYYWTSTTCARLPDQAWYIHLGGARVFKGMKAGSYMVWPVRRAGNGEEKGFYTGQRHCYGEDGSPIDCAGTGQDAEFAGTFPANADRFVQRGHVVEDRFTGLSWYKDANPGEKMMSWPEARSFVEKLNADRANGFDNWRLPEILELESLTDLGQHTPALPAGHPFTNVQEFYWSSTTSAYETTYAWALYMKDGIVGVGHKPLPEFFVWPVRSDFETASMKNIADGRMET